MKTGTLAITLIVGLASQAHAQWSFWRIADTSTPAPSAPGNFYGFQPPAISNGRVAFAASASPAGKQAVFNNAGGSLVMNSYYFGTVYETYVYNPAIDSGSVVYTEALSNSWSYVRTANNAIVCGYGSAWQPAACANMGLPTRPSLDAGRIAYGGTRSISGWETPVLGGLFVAANGQIAQLVSRNSTPVPNASGQVFMLADSPRIRGNTVMFTGSGSGGRVGIYAVPASGGPVTVVMDQTSAHNATGAIGTFYAPSFDGVNTAFCVRMNASTHRAIFRTEWSGRVKVAESSMGLPGLAAPISLGDEPSIIGVRTFFTASKDIGTAAEKSVLFMHSRDPNSPTYTRVIGTGDALDGRTVRTVSIGRDGFDGAYIGIRVTFTNGTSGVYASRLPTQGGTFNPTMTVAAERPSGSALSRN